MKKILGLVLVVALLSSVAFAAETANAPVASAVKSTVKVKKHHHKKHHKHHKKHAVKAITVK